MDACHGVLLVEDDGDIRECVAEVLEEEGYAVASVGNGREALDHLRSEAQLPPCLIILDLMMPVMDGWQFRLEQLKDPLLASIPVVVLTADGNALSNASAMHAAGALTKPVRLEHLLGEVARHCLA
jgi:CheY-like chemotaxis protein